MDRILIVGAGPTGLMTALTLAQRGIKARIIDKKEKPITTSNALAIQPRTLEIWEKMGLIDEAMKEGHIIKGMTINSSTGLLTKISMQELPTKYPHILVLPQAKTEKLLTKHLERYGVSVERGVSLENLTEQSSSVKTTCNGHTETYSWVIGCDGAKSAVRESAHIPFEGYDLKQHFIMADVQIDWHLSADEGHVFYASDGPLVFFPIDQEGFGRLIIDVTAQKIPEPSFQDFQKLMKQRCPIPATLRKPTWISSFWIHCRVAKTYQKGRLFLAGDAAHLHSPFGGQGLNIGAQDAYFLANLLADISEGRKPIETIQEYTAKRRPIGKSVVNATARATELVTTQSKFLQTIRNHLIPLALKIPYVRRRALMTLSQLIYR